MSSRQQQLRFAGFDEASARPNPQAPPSDSPAPSRPEAEAGADSPSDVPAAPAQSERPDPSALVVPSADAAFASRPSSTVSDTVELEDDLAGETQELIEASAAETGDLLVELASGPPLAGKTVYVIDAHSLLYQVFHAMPEMTSPAGLPVAAVHGFTRDLADMLEKRQPDYLFCAFDEPGGTFRDSLYTAYKEHRAEMPADLQLQIPLVKRMLEALGIPALGAPGYEADDILAKLAREVDRRGGECFLVTTDKDCRQLISDRVRMLNIRKNELFDADALLKSWGVRPEQVVDYQALVGDSVDNVPGVPQIGPKAAQELLQQFGTLDEILARTSEITAKRRRETLEQHREQALVSRQLVRLEDQVPIDIPWELGRAGRIRSDAVRQLCEEFGFRRLGERLGQWAGARGEAVWEATYRAITTEAELRELVEILARSSRIAFDTETTSERPRWAELVGLSFAWEVGQAAYVPVKAPPGEPCLDRHLVLDALRPVLENPAIAKIGQNVKYDLIVLRGAGVDVRGVAFDSMVADYLIDPGERTHNLDDLARRHLGHTTIRIESLIGTGKQQRRMDEVPVAQIAEYAAEDADVPWRLAKYLEPRLESEGLSSLFHELEVPLVEVLAELEFNGIRVDVDRLQGLSRRFGEQLAVLEAEIYLLAGGPFNIDSPQQMGKVLFDQLGLPVIKKTKTGRSTDADVLAELAPLHPLPAKVVEYRQIAKLKGTYADSLPELVYAGTNRVHTSFKQDVAATGRLSSTDPNLQNIPVRSEAGREIRSAFLPGRPGWKLVAADYSQIELRVLAHCSGDAALQEAFARDEDIHTRVAGEVHGVSADQVTKEMRRAAKAVNFGVIYGQSAFGLAQALGISKDEAARFIDAYFARYPGVSAFIERTLEETRASGYVSTVLGRRRAIQGIRPPAQRGDSRQRNLPERIAINTVIQGSAADLIKQAMIGIHRRLGRSAMASKMLLQIHDELVFEAPADEVAPLRDLVRDEMVRVGRLSVPLRVSVKVGENWAECEEE